jgi:hypothetical protein
MDDLSPNTRALLDAARSFDDPSDADRDRVHASVMMRIGGVAAIGTAAITAAKSSSAAASAAPLIANSLTTTTVFSGLVAKVGVAVVLAGAVASGAYVALRPAHSVALSAKPAIVAPLAAPVAAAPAVAAIDPAPAAVDPEDLPLDDAKPNAARLGRAKSADLEGEMTLLRTADAALRRGDSAAALAALNKHAALYPKGVLSQEREGVRAIALCSGGNLSQGQSAAQRFLARAAKSPLASRIRSACSLGE